MKSIETAKFQHFHEFLATNKEIVIVKLMQANIDDFIILPDDFLRKISKKNVKVCFLLSVQFECQL